MKEQKVEILDNDEKTIIKINNNQIHNIIEYTLTHEAMKMAKLTIMITLPEKNIQIKKVLIQSTCEIIIHNYYTTKS